MKIVNQNNIEAMGSATISEKNIWYSADEVLNSYIDVYNG